MKITVDETGRLRNGSVIGKREGVIVWFGPLERFPNDKGIDEVLATAWSLSLVKRTLIGNDA